MKKIGMIFLAGMFCLSFSQPVFASDWEVAGKVLAGIEGLRVLTGGKVDFIGAITGIGNNRYPDRHRPARYSKHHQRVWVCDYVWEKKWVPAHREYDEKYGEIFVEGHYIECRVERGGHWE
jgi:hypothetical protein